MLASDMSDIYLRGLLFLPACMHAVAQGKNKTGLLSQQETD